MKTNMLQGIGLVAAVAAMCAGGCAAPRVVGGLLPEECRAAAALVAYRLKGGEPDGLHLQLAGERCPNCGKYHSDSLDDVVKKERSHFAPGFFVAPDRVVTEDIFLHPDNLSGVSVNGRRAVIEKRFPERKALLLKVEGADQAALALVPGKAVYAAQANLHAMMRNQLLAPKTFEPPFTASARLLPGQPAASPALLLDARQRPVGFSFDGTGEPFDPLTAPSVAPDADLTAPALAAAARFVVPVTLTFRPPRKERAGNESGEPYFGRRRWRFSDGDDDDDRDAAERQTFAFRATPDRVLVFTQTAHLDRLEKITVQISPSNAVTATFAHAYRHLALIAADLPTGAAAPLPAISDGAAAGCAAVAVAVSPDGQGRVDYRAVPVFLNPPGVGWRDIPCQDDLPLAVGNRWTDAAASVFIFPLGDAAAAPFYISVPLVFPPATVGGGGYQSDNREQPLIQAAAFSALAQPDKSDIDPVRKPLPAGQEPRAGGLGFEVQPMARVLAEARGILTATSGGKYGGLVTSVAKGSPAEAAGVQSGWVLLTLQPEGGSRPLTVELKEDDRRGEENFPWEQLDQVPAQYFSHLPTPWPAVVSPLNETLGRFGIGSAVEARFLLPDGSRAVRVLTVVEAPLAYANAPAQAWKAAGVTLCVMTQDVRDYLGLAPDAPGLVVCAAEPGGAAVAAGLRPFELVTHVNGQPLKSLEEVNAFASKVGVYRLNVTRMTASRVVSFTTKAEEQ